MKLIIFHPLTSTAPHRGFYKAVKIAYMLNGNTAIAGINEQIYDIVVKKEENSPEMKLQFMLDNNEEEEWRAAMIKAQAILVTYKKQKNINSRMMMNRAQITKKVNLLFDEFISLHFNSFDKKSGIQKMNRLLNPDYFYFYRLKQQGKDSGAASSTSVMDLMQLLLPDPEKENPMFVIDRQADEGRDIGINLYMAYSKEAENLENCYAQRSFHFPSMDLLTENEVSAGRSQLEKITREFRDKIDKWASICYANPASADGLNYFRKNLDGYLPTLENTFTESPVLKSCANKTNYNDKAEVIFGQMPIERIWQIYRATECISEKEYNELMNIKELQYPKYEGRWPVMYYHLLKNDFDSSPNETENETLKSVRKSIAVD